MRWPSFRFRLMLWNAAILSLVLGGFGLCLCYTLQLHMGVLVDRELAARVHDPPRGRHPPRRAHGRPHRHLTMDAWVSFLTQPSPSQPDRPVVSMRRLFRVPRFVTLQGEVLGPPGIREPWDPATVPDAIAGRPRYSTIRVGEERVRVYSAPWVRRGAIVGAVQVARGLDEQDQLWTSQLRALLTLLPLALLCAGLGGLLLTHRALHPVRQVTQAAAEIGAHDLSRRLPVTGQDELAELAATFNGMIARLEGDFEQQRRFTADASHELRTPLARLKVTTSLALASEQSPEEYRQALAIADQSADVMDRLIQQLLVLARADAGQLRLERSRIDLCAVLQQSAAASARADAACLVVKLPPHPLEMEGDAEHLARVFVNLLENALRHTPPDGVVTLSARIEKGTLVAQVADTGEGIPPEHIAHVCERFYRVDASRSRKSGGSGLGLAISQSIVHAHGGQLSIRSTPGRGTVVTVTLPPAGSSSVPRG